MPITVDALLDSLMRAALSDVTTTAGLDANGQAIITTSRSPLMHMVEQIHYEISRNDDFKRQFIEAVMQRVPNIADAVALKMPDTIVYKKQVSSYPSTYADAIAPWVEAAVKDALAEALKPAIAEYVKERFPTADLDSMGITVNIEVKLS